jgi:hypothetical protein
MKDPTKGANSERTRLEIEAGRRALFRVKQADAIQTLKKVGLKDVDNMDETILQIHMAFADHAGVVPEKSTYQCGICECLHKHGERCPNRSKD